VTGGELAQQIFAKQRPSEETIKFYFFQMVQAVKVDILLLLRLFLFQGD